MNDEDMRFASMSGRGVHDKVLEIAEPYLANAQILIAGAGGGALEHKLLRNGAPAEKIQAVDCNPSQYKLESVDVQFVI